MRPLELTIWMRGRLAIDGSACYRLGSRVLRADFIERLAKQKQFTDAEFAAEYWRTTADVDLISEGLIPTSIQGWDRSEYAAFGRRDTLHRFATRPHYSDAD